MHNVGKRGQKGDFGAGQGAGAGCGGRIRDRDGARCRDGPRGQDL